MNQGRTETTTSTRSVRRLAALLFAGVFSLIVGASNNVHSAPTIPDISQFTVQYAGLSTNDIIKKAVSGDVLAQHELGNRLAGGSHGLPANPSAAAMWYSRAAQRGFPGSPSLDRLPNFPVRIDRTVASSPGIPPVARLAAADPALSTALIQTVDGSASSGSQAINRVIWNVLDEDGNESAVAVITPMAGTQAQIQFPDYGVWFVTLSVMDSKGQLDHVTQQFDLGDSTQPPVDSPVAVGPSQQSVVFEQTTNFQWQTIEGASSYEFELYFAGDDDAEPLFVSELLGADCSDLLCTIPILMDYPNVGTYRWRVRALDASATSEWTESTFTVRPAMPQNTLPLVNTNINEGATVTFVWQASALADNYDFHFFDRVSGTDVDFENDLLPSDVCVGNECSFTKTITLPISDDHAWRVRAKFSGVVSDWSRSAFNVIEPVTESPLPPTQLLPVAEAVVEENLSQVFSWMPAVLASAYEFQLINGDPDEVPLPENSVIAYVPANSCTASRCFVSAIIDYPVSSEPVWRVRSINPAGESEWVLSTLNVIAMALAIPETPIIVAPLSNTDLITNEIADFVWQYDPQASTYEFFFFDNAPPNRGERLPYITGLRPQDLCDDTVCTFPQLVDLPVFNSHAWRVRARNSLGVSALSQTYFNVVEPVTEAPPAPVAISPLADANLELDSTVSFSWAALEAATQYEFQILDTQDETFNAITAFIPAASCPTTSCSVSITVSFPLSEHYQWQVRASNAAGVSAFTESPFSLIPAATVSPDTPVNLTPEAGLQLIENEEVEFTWAKESNSVNYEFHFFDNLAKDTTPIIAGLRARDICNDTQCSLALPVELPVASDHAWRVRGQNSLGYSAWSRSVFDVIEPITEPPSAFVLVAPASDEVLFQDNDAVFSWQPALRAISYEISLFDGTDATNTPLVDTVLATVCTLDLCRYVIPMTFPVAENHSWQVRAINSLGESESFISIFAVALEVIEPPRIPVAIAPDAGAAFVSGTSIDFQWQADFEATSYEFYFTDAINGALPITSELLPSQICDAGVCSHSVIVDLPFSELHTWHVRMFRDELASGWSQRAITIVDSLGSESPVAQIVIAGFAGDATGVAPLTITVDPSNSYDDVGIVSYEWDFGDSSEPVVTTTPEMLTHEYLEPGSYTVTLTVTDVAELSASTTASATVFDPANSVSAIDASRLLTQATFGPNMGSIFEVQTLGIENWIEQQFTLQGPAHLDYVLQHSTSNSSRHVRHEAWWTDVVDGDDQLRQRVAFALSQIFVVSDTGYTFANAQYGMTHYYDLLREHAFGNYRELLEEVTLNPTMGLFLSMLQNAKGDPAASTRADENFAREVLQLFSIGLHQLNLDGTTDGTPSFAQENIEAFARVFTGWNYADAGTWDRRLFTNADMISPMRPFEQFHDTASKTLLNNAVSPAGQSARADLEFALNNIFNHPNVGPFIAKHLIKRLVTSNPSVGYVSDVASIFNDNGVGVRGDLKAVVREILLNDEARTIPSTAAYGKLREPVLRLTHLWRAFDIQPGTESSSRGEYNTISPVLMNLEQVTGQAVLRAPSVFNFFEPSYSPAGPVADQNLVAPEFELFTESNELATTNRIGRQIQVDYASNASSSHQLSFLDFTDELTIAGDTDALLDHLNVILLSGNMSSALHTALSSHLNALPDTPTGLSQRVRDAVTLIMASPDYLIQM